MACGIRIAQGPAPLFNEEAPMPERSRGMVPERSRGPCYYDTSVIDSKNALYALCIFSKTRTDSVNKSFLFLKCLQIL